MELRTETFIEEVKRAEIFLYLEDDKYVYIVPQTALGTGESDDIYEDDITERRVRKAAVLIADKVQGEVVKSRFF